MTPFLAAPRGQAGWFGRLRRLWWAAAALALTVVAHFALTLAALESGARPMKTLYALVGLALVIVAIPFVLTEGRIRRVQAWLRPVRGWIGPALLIGLLAVGLRMRTGLVYDHLLLTLAVTAALVFVTLTGDDRPVMPRRLWLVALVALVVGATLLRIGALSEFPSIDLTDEPWNLSKSVSYLQTGTVSQFTVVGAPGDATHSSTFYLPRWAIPVAWWLGVTGVGLWQARLFDLLVIGLIILATARAAHRYYGGMAGFFTAAALFASMLLMLAVRVRPDVGLALALAVSLWLHSETVRRERAWLHLLAGLVMGWGGFAHYHALVFAPIALVALYLPRTVTAFRSGRRWPEGGAWLYALGVFLGLGMVGLVQVFPDLATFLAVRAPRTPASLQDYVGQTIQYLRFVPEISAYEAILIVVGVLAALRRRKSFDVSLLLLALLMHLALPALTNIQKDYYLVPLTPVYGLLVGAFLSETLGARRWSDSLTVLVVGLFLLMPALGQTLKTPFRDVVARHPLIAPPRPAAQWVLDHVRPMRRVLAENLYYDWLYDYDFISPWLLESLPKAAEGYDSTADFWLSLRPDVIIYDPDIGTYYPLDVLLQDPDLLPAHGYALVVEFPGGVKGPVVVYAREGVDGP